MLRDNIGGMGGRRALDMIGFRSGRLLVVSRAPSVSNNAQWNCVCDCGNQVIRTGNDLRTGKAFGCGCQRGVGGGPKPTFAGKYSYKTAHALVARRKGSPRSHRCVDCGEQADDWTLRHDAAVTYEGETGRGAVCKFSSDPLDYEPRCRTCHRRYDRP